MPVPLVQDGSCAGVFISRLSPSLGISLLCEGLFYELRSYTVQNEYS